MSNKDTDSVKYLEIYPDDVSPSSCDTLPSARKASTSSSSSALQSLTPRPPPVPSCIIPPLRPGTIIKGVRGRRSPLNANPKANSGSGYTLREKAAPRQGGKWCFIVNGTKRSLWTDYCPRLLSQLNGVEHKIYMTKSRGHARHLAEKSCRSGASLVVAVGGNGTLNEVVDGVLRSGVTGADGLPYATVAVIPLGSTSDFHRSMSWQASTNRHNFEEAIARLGRRGETVVLDVGRIVCDSPKGTIERHFINVVSCGASARAAMLTSRWKWLGNCGKYRMATLSALFKNRNQNLGIRVDGGVWKKVKDASLLAVGNGSYFCHGINICPGANPYDGKFQMVCASQIGPISFFSRLWKFKMGKHVDSKDIQLAEVNQNVDVAPWRGGRPVFDLLPTAYTPTQSGPSASSSDSSCYIERVQSLGSSLSAGTSPQLLTPGGSLNLEPLRIPSYPTSSGTDVSAQTQRMGRFEDENIGSSSSISSPSNWESDQDSGNVSSPEFQEQDTVAQQTMSNRPDMVRNPQKDDLGSTCARSKNPSNRSKRKVNKVKSINEDDYGPIPVEVDGEVIGFAPFSISVIPGAIKFRVLGSDLTS